MTKSTPVHDSRSSLAAIFGAIGESAHKRYTATSLSPRAAHSRTGSNREALVLEVLTGLLPVGVQLRHGCVIIDALGGSSRDVDVVALNPWAAPVWPGAHGLVPVEGVLSAVFVESNRIKKTTGDQIVSAKTLLKSLEADRRSPRDKTCAYGTPRSATRDYRPCVGLWCWVKGRPADPDGYAREAETKCDLGYDVISAAFEQRAQSEWACPDQDQKGNAPAHFRANAIATNAKKCGWHLPDWIYVHGKTGLLLVRRGPVLTEDPVVPAPPQLDGKADKVIPGGLDGKNPSYHWLVYGPHVARAAGAKSEPYFALRVLSLVLAYEHTVYSAERPFWGKYQ